MLNFESSDLVRFLHYIKVRDHFTVFLSVPSLFYSPIEMQTAVNGCNFMISFRFSLAFNGFRNILGFPAVPPMSVFSTFRPTLIENFIFVCLQFKKYKQ